MCISCFTFTRKTKKAKISKRREEKERKQRDVLLWENLVRDKKERKKGKGKKYSALGHVACNYTSRFHETKLYYRRSNAICARCPRRKCHRGTKRRSAMEVVGGDCWFNYNRQLRPVPSAIQPDFHPLFAPLLSFTRCVSPFSLSRFQMFSPEVFIFLALGSRLNGRQVSRLTSHRDG